MLDGVRVGFDDNGDGFGGRWTEDCDPFELEKLKLFAS